MKPLWKKIRYRIEWLAVAGGAKIVPILPRWMLLRLAGILGRLAYHLDKRGRTTALANLRSVFPGSQKSDAEIRVCARRSFQFFAQSMLDLFWTRRINARNLDKYVRYEIEDPEALERAKETGAIWVTPHYANFEWIAMGMGFRGYPFCIVAENFKNPLLTPIFTRNREHSGHSIIPQERAMIRLVKHLKNKGHAAFLPDLTVKPGRAATIIECFGLKTCATILHATLAQRTGLPVIPGICIPQKDGSYVTEIYKPLEIAPEATEEEIATQCWQVFEETIRKHPEPWLWMYKHWRFRERGEAGDKYPDYANHSKAFDKMLGASS